MDRGRDRGVQESDKQGKETLTESVERRTIGERRGAETQGSR